MSDSIRRLICRAVFVLCCLVPTLLVANWVIFPKKTSSWELELRSLLGSRLVISSVETPTPQVTLFKDVTIPLSGDDNLCLSQIKSASLPNQRQITINQLSVGIDDIKPLLTTMMQGIVQQNLQEQVQIKINQLELLEQSQNGSSRRLTLRPFTVDLNQSMGETNAIVKAVVPDSQQTILFRISIDSRSSPQTIQWELDCRSQAIDSWVLLPWFDWLVHCGDQCEFTGLIRTQSIDNTIEQASLSGSLTKIDGDVLIDQQFGFGFDGLIHLNIENCQIIEGRIEDMAGVVHCSSGKLQSSWIVGTQQWLNLGFAYQQNSPTVPFKDLNLQFRIRNGWVQLRGNDRQIVAFDDAQDALLITSNMEQHPVSNLVRVLMPADHRNLPITRETLPLASVLPIPFGQE